MTTLLDCEVRIAQRTRGCEMKKSESYASAWDTIAGHAGAGREPAGEGRANAADRCLRRYAVPDPGRGGATLRGEAIADQRSAPRASFALFVGCAGKHLHRAGLPCAGRARGGLRIRHSCPALGQRGLEPSAGAGSWWSQKWSQSLPSHGSPGASEVSRITRK